MQTDQELSFGRYRLSLEQGLLWRGQQEVKLTPKAFAVLRVLVMRAGRVVTKDEIFAAVWPQTVVSDDALTTCILELRQALHDNAKQRRYIETIYGRGYRFIGKVVSDQLSVVSREEANQKAKGKNQKAKIEDFFPTPNPQSPTPSFVGRESELTQLHGWLAKALNGERQIVFVTGEPGIGKTTLIEVFVSGVQRSATDPRSLIPDPWISRGQCIEHYGVGEAYLPILEALGRLSREPDGQHLIELLSQHAPTWLVQMPALLHPDEIEALHRKTAGATRERMLRELAEALEVITAERPLILWLEDLHWSDVSTLDWLTCVARRQELARLLVLGTYRPVDVMVREHPLKTVKQELQLHGHCQELALDFLREGDVTEYLTVRFSVGTTHAAPLRSLARIIHRRTDGNPLFMVNLIEHLLSRGVLVQTDRQWVLKNEDLAGTVPEDLRQLIEQQIMRISPDERKILEVASVAGAEFSAAAVAAGTGQSTEVVETHCDTLVRREQFLRTQGTGEWPDGTVAARYGFVHALYQEVLYEQLSATRRMRLHRQIGEREEQGYSDRASERAAELAMHFERGRETKRAIQYLQHAGKNAVRRSAHQEAVTLLTKGLELLKTLPDTPERTRQELTLQIALGAPLQAIKGFAASEVKNAYARARELCQQIGETPQLFPILHGLWTFYLMRTEFQTAQELGNQLLTLAQKIQDPALLLQAHSMLGLTLWPLGEIVSARAHLEQSLAFYDPQKSRSSVGMTLMSIVASVTSSMEALALWLLGYPDQALQRDHEALTLVQDLARPHGLAMALTSSGWLHQFRREGQAAQARAEAAIALSIEQGFAHLLAVGTSQRGWALTQQGQEEEGIMQLRQGLAASRATGQELYLSCPLALLAEAYGNTGQPKEGLAVLAEALAMVNKTGERYYEAELYRIKGELTLQNGARDWGLGAGSPSPQAPSLKPQTPKEVVREAEEYFLKAITIAQKQQAKSLELRAVISLSRLWQQQGRQKQARKLLAEIYGWFTEGFDTKDLQEAKALLEVSH